MLNTTSICETSYEYIINVLATTTQTCYKPIDVWIMYAIDLTIVLTFGLLVAVAMKNLFK